MIQLDELNSNIAFHLNESNMHLDGLNAENTFHSSLYSV